jgi:hypothetical protein
MKLKENFKLEFAKDEGTTKNGAIESCHSPKP